MPHLSPFWKRWIATSLLLSTPLLMAGQIAGRHFDDHIRLADTDLVLNGMGLRAVLWFKGYAAGLYLHDKATSLPKVLSISGPKRVQIQMLLEVKAQEFVKAVDVGMQRNHTEAEHKALQERIQRFNATIEQVKLLKVGDVVNLDYVPEKGTTLVVNGKVQGAAVMGEDFYAGLLKIFMGEKPVDSKLKAGLLGAQ
jgi:Chalcone isomerase-like